MLKVKVNIDEQPETKERGVTFELIREEGEPLTIYRDLVSIICYTMGGFYSPGMTSQEIIDMFFNDLKDELENTLAQEYLASMNDSTDNKLN